MAEGKIEEIGKIRLDLTHYPGEDLYCDGDVEDELLKITRDYAEVEYQRIIEERRSWPVLYHLSGLRENIVEWLPIGSNDKVLEIGDKIIGICKEPLCFEAILQKLFTDYGLTMNFEQYVLVGSTVRSYLAWLKDTGKITVQFKNNTLLWVSL